MQGERRSVRARRRAWTAAVCVVILAGLFVGYLAISHNVTTVRRPTGCSAEAPGDSGWHLAVSQAQIAATIAGVADRRGMPTRALAIAYAAAMQESGLANLDYGDRDSVGVFQQRPSEGWGTTRQIEDPIYASNRFFAALAAVHGYLHMQIYQAAQAVQRSADGQAYAEWALPGTQMAQAFSGQRPHAVWCSYATIGRQAKLASAGGALRRTFGLGRVQVRRDRDSGGRVGRSRVASAPVNGARQGWAVAAWLVCNASSYGIRDVRYESYQWLSYTGTGRWVRRHVAARAPAATAVYFG